jgi:hypothetical protein
MFMPLARLVQYQHCLLRRNGVRTDWSAAKQRNLSETLERLRSEFGRQHPT